VNWLSLERATSSLTGSDTKKLKSCAFFTPRADGPESSDHSQRFGPNAVSVPHARHRIVHRPQLLHQLHDTANAMAAIAVFTLSFLTGKVFKRPRTGFTSLDQLQAGA
jgi:hypothetical protein